MMRELRALGLLLWWAFLCLCGVLGFFLALSVVWNP